MADHPNPAPSWHSNRWYKNHPEATRPPQQPATAVPSKNGFGMGRAIALSAGLVMLSGASQLALAKGWADWIPNWAVIALYATALIPIGYWLISHNRLLRHRAWIGSKLKTRPYLTVGALIIVACIVAICLTVISSLVLAKVAKHKQNEGPNAQATSTSSPSKPNLTGGDDINKMGEAPKVQITQSHPKKKLHASKSASTIPQPFHGGNGIHIIDPSGKIKGMVIDGLNSHDNVGDGILVEGNPDLQIRNAHTNNNGVKNQQAKPDPQR